MDRYFACLGLISYLAIGTLAQEYYVTVSEDIKVRPTPNQLTDSKDKVNVTLNCTGSQSELNFYIKNRVVWDFIGADKKVKGLSQSFYLHPKSEYASIHSASGHITYKFEQKPTSGLYVFSVLIAGVTAADDGIYRCSLLNEADNITDTKDVRLVVVNPVTAMSIELHDANHNLVVQSSSVSLDMAPMLLTPGRYMVGCSASGSNPEPIMELFYNDEKLSATPNTEIDQSAGHISYKGYIPMKRIAIIAQNSIQALTCTANIAGGYYRSEEATIALMVEVNKPNVKCDNATAALTDKHTNLKCLISSPGNNGALNCTKVRWLLSNNGIEIEFDQRWKDPKKVFDIMEGTCQKGKDGLTVHLDLYTTTPAMFEETFFVVYGIGHNAHRHAIVLHDVTVAAAGVVTPLSLLVSLIMALVSKHLANL